MITCGGGDCQRKRDCVRWLERNQHPFGERYPVTPFKFVRAKDATGRPLQGTVQVCEAFKARELV